MERERILGMVLMGIGGFVFTCFTAVFLVGWLTDPELDLAAALMGIAVFGGLPLLFFGGLGWFLYEDAQAKKEKWLQEQREREQQDRRERLLGMIQAYGQVTLDKIVEELGLEREAVLQLIYELVGEGKFAGYIDWSSETFVSADAAKVGSTTCPNCGGIREFVGQGIVKCPYCGASLFIPPGAPQTRSVPRPPEGWQGAPPSGGGAGPVNPSAPDVRA